jgi:hypothetical protein
MGGRKGESDLNRSRETVPLEGERLPKDGRPFALVLQRRRGLGMNVHPCAPGEGANNRPQVGERSLPQCLQHFGEDLCERSPKGGRTFASSVSLALWRRLLGMIAQGWVNVRFLSKFGTLEETCANDRPRVDERSLPQCANSHYARIKL